MHRISFALAAPLLGLLLACGGSGGVGEPCDTRGSTDECGENSICDEAEGEEGPVCLEICESQEDCGAGTSCNGVSGSNIKACHPNDDGDGDDGDGKDK